MTALLLLIVVGVVLLALAVRREIHGRQLSVTHFTSIEHTHPAPAEA
jgi:hypothetical protein